MTIPTTDMLEAWHGFSKGEWQTNVNTRDFIQTNYTPYEGDESFLADATDATTSLWNDMQWKALSKKAVPMHRLILTQTYLQQLPLMVLAILTKNLETIVGLQTDKPLKRAIIANGGIRMVKNSCEVDGRELDPMVEKIFTDYRKTHNKACFDLYTKEI